jgi:hypothetical protein
MRFSNNETSKESQISGGTMSSQRATTRLFTHKARWLSVVIATTLTAFLVFRQLDAADNSGQQELLTVPKAQCGPKDRTERVQGETTLAERFSPGPSKAYNCNLELIGQYTGEGSSIGMNVYESFAYVTTWKNPDTKHPGVTVVDVSDPRRPKVSAYLDTPAVIEANESLAISKSRKLLLAAAWSSSTFDIYDLSKDPGHPALISSGTIPGVMEHMGEFSPDGRIFFGASLKANPTQDPSVPPSAIFAIDVSDPAHPKPITA